MDIMEQCDGNGNRNTFFSIFIFWSEIAYSLYDNSMIHCALAFGAIERMLNVAQKWWNWRLLLQSNYFDTHIRALQKCPPFVQPFSFHFFNHSNRLSSTPRLACLLLYQWCAFLWHHFYSEWLNWFYAWINICRFLMTMMQQQQQQHMLSLAMYYYGTIILTLIVVIR